jgi:hypothetical protein
MGYFGCQRNAGNQDFIPRQPMLVGSGGPGVNLLAFKAAR